MTTTLLIIFLCSFLAFSLSAICGGGAGLILIPILGGLLPVSQVPTALSIGTFTSSFSRIILFYKSICWDIVKWFVPAAIPAVWLGAWLLKFLNPLYLEVAIGLFLIANLPFVFKKEKDHRQVAKPSHGMLSLIGFTAGFLSGLTGAVGLLFNRFYLRYGLGKEEIVATRAANEILLHLIKIILYALFGLISSKAILLGTVVAASALLSSWSMKWILPRLSDATFKKVGYSAMVLSGFTMLGKSSKDLFVDNNGDIFAKPIAKGLEATLQWQKANYSLEFTYDEGFEFELVVPMEEMSQAHKKFVLEQQGDADQIVIERVHTVQEQTYEAYYFKAGKFVKKIDFK